MHAKKDTDDEHDEPVAMQFHPGGVILMTRSGTCHVQANTCIAESKFDAIVMKGFEDSPLRWDTCTSSFKGCDAGNYRDRPRTWDSWQPDSGTCPSCGVWERAW